MRRGVLEREARSLQARFGHRGLGVRIEPVFPVPLDLSGPLPMESPADPSPALLALMKEMAQGLVGLMLGNLVAVVVLGVAGDWLPSGVRDSRFREAALYTVILLVSRAVGLL